MDNATLQEIGKLWDKCNELEKKLSDLTEDKTSEIDKELAESMLMFVEMINDINETLEEVSENE